MSTLQVPIWAPIECDGPNDAGAVLAVIRAERAATERLRNAEAEARVLIARAEEDERKRQRAADAALWNAYLGRDAESNRYDGCGCDDY
jgi:hypothetical protein